MAEGTSATSWWQRLVSVAKTLFWLVLVVVVLQQVYGSNKVENARTSVLDRFQQERKSRVIALIHRQETVTLFGVPVSSSISIEDSEAVLRAIRLTPPEQPIDVILHTPGGLVLAAEQIAKALVQRKAKVTAFVPHYAMSGGSLIALAADEIVMDPNAVLGPVDPQIGDMPAASIIKLLSLKKPEDISDEMLILADMSAKARVQVGVFVMEVLLKHMSKEKAVALATTSVIPATLVQGALREDAGVLAPFEEARKQFERDYLVRLLKITGGNVTQAATLAKRNRTEFYKLLQRHRLEPAMFKEAKS